MYTWTQIHTGLGNQENGRKNMLQVVLQLIFSKRKKQGKCLGEAKLATMEEKKAAHCVTWEITSSKQQ